MPPWLTRGEAWGILSFVGRGTRVFDVRVGGEVVRVVSVPVQERPLAALSPAERAVVALALEGLSNDQIACRRGSSTRTVANQLASAYRKLGVSGRAELAAAGGRR
jgi:DNA-binding CsgD family transcriptional regulator